jgi:rhodanese-related sulfurtransferase
MTLFSMQDKGSFSSFRARLGWVQEMAKPFKADWRHYAALILISALAGGMVGASLTNSLSKQPALLFEDFYTVETAVSVSPSDFIADLQVGKTDGLLVDLRAPSEYAAGHLVTAVNVPAIQMDSNRLLAAFQQLPKDKPVITYCYSSYCMLSRHVGKALADKGIFVQHLTAGWYEINRDLNAFVVTGPNPGTLDANQLQASTACSVNAGGEFRC